MKAWKAILAAVVIFLAGIVSGALGAQLYHAQTRHVPARVYPGGPPLPGLAQRMEFMRRLSDRLDLRQDQRERIDAMVRESQQRLRELWEPIEPKAKEELRQLHKHIEAELTPAQRARFEKLLHQHSPRPSTESPPRRRLEG